MKSKSELALVIDNAIQEEISPVVLTNTEHHKKLEDVLHCLRLSGHDIIRVGEVFLDEMIKGMKDEPSSLLMENTYIPELIDGSEEGEFLGLDLGGTNFRVLVIKLKDGKIISEKSETFEMAADVRLGTGEKLFDYLAECVASFAKKENVASKQLNLGFTFSFPMHQRSLHCAVLNQWTKSFAATDVEGNDVVKMLQQALERRGDVHVNVNAILNDTTGTLLQGCLNDKRTRIGLILGTGSNACYLERADRISHWECERHNEKEIVIDIEWGAFGDNGVLEFMRTQFDRQLDNESLFINSFCFEKYISGLYLGELVRIILLHLANNRLLFRGVLSKEIQVKEAFLSKYVSLIEKDTINNETVETEKICNLLKLKYHRDDIVIIKFVCELVSRRGAQLVAACLAKLIKQMDKPDVTIAVDGSLYKNHPRYKMWIEKYTAFLAPGFKFRLEQAVEGSGKGACIASAIAARLEKAYMS